MEIDRGAWKEEKRMERDADGLKGKLLLWISTSRSTTESLDGDLGVFNVVRGYVCTIPSRSVNISFLSLEKCFDIQITARIVAASISNDRINDDVKFHLQHLTPQILALTGFRRAHLHADARDNPVDTLSLQRPIGALS